MSQFTLDLFLSTLPNVKKVGLLLSELVIPIAGSDGFAAVNEGELKGELTTSFEGNSSHDTHNHRLKLGLTTTYSVPVK